MKKNLKRTSIGFLGLLMLISTASCSNKASSSSSTPSETSSTVIVNDGSYSVDKLEKVTLKMATQAKASLMSMPGQGQAMQYFSDTIAERSNGKVKIKIFLDGQLGSSADELIGGCTTGAFEMFTLNQGSWGGYTNAFMPFNLPFLFSSEEMAFKFMDGDQGQVIRDRILDDTGVRNLVYLDIGFRQLTTRDTPVHTAADMAGLKIRTMSDPYQIATFEALGCAVTSVAYSELFSALQQGLVRAQENPLENIIVQKFPEVQNYLTLTGHSYSLTTININNELFEGFSPDLQNLILEVSAETQEFCRKGMMSQQKSYREELEPIIEIYEPTAEELATFKEQTASVWTDIKADIGDDWYNSIVKEIERLSNS